MTRSRLTLLGLLAALMVGGLSAAAARAECAGAAPEHKCVWEIKEPGGGFEELSLAEEEINTVANELSTFKLIAGAKEITCTNINLFYVLAGSKPGKGYADKFLLSGCSTTEAGCKVKSKGNTKAGEILITNIRTTLVEREKGAEKNILSDNFEQKTRKHAKEWVTLEFGKKEKVVEAGTRFERKELEEACAGYANTKVVGNIAAKVEAEKLNFPNPSLSENTLKAFGVGATLTGTVKPVLEEPGEYKAN
jgi:hypothetical protein